MLDHLSGGRLEIGVGRGVSPFELAYYGVPFLDSREIFEEALDVIVAGLRNSRLTHRGAHYRFQDVPIELRPRQRPNPQFWYGVTSPESLMLAARRGMNMVGGGPVSMLKETAARFREEFASQGWLSRHQSACHHANCRRPQAYLCRRKRAAGRAYRGPGLSGLLRQHHQVVDRFPYRSGLRLHARPGGRAQK
jgi:hypothetical protein